MDDELEFRPARYDEVKGAFETGERGLVDSSSSVRTLSSLAVLAYLLAVAVPALTVPALGQAPALPWAGQATCALDVQQEGYAHQETQTWTITGTAPRADSANAPVYDATWSFSGAGSMQRVRGAQTIAAAWNRAGAPVPTAIAISVRPAGQLVFRSWRSQLHSQGATTGLQKVMGAGGQASPSEIRSDVYEWPFPTIDAAGNTADVSGTGTIVVNGGILPMQPPSTNFTAACEWHFVRGGSASAPPEAPAPAGNLAPSSPVVQGGVIPLQGSTGGTAVASLGIAAPRPSGSSSITSGSTVSASSSSGSSPSGTAGTGSAASGSTSSTPTDLCSTVARSGAPAAPAAPEVAIGPGSVMLSWAAPAGGGAIDAYEVESQPSAGGPATQQTVKAPGTSAKLALSACAYPAGNCSAAGGYAFRVRAHNGAGCGPYSSSTANVRPLVSYAGDNVAGIWSASNCLQCHTGPGVSLDLSGPASDSYNRVGLYSARKPGNRDKLLACPSGGSCVIPAGNPHPLGFSTTSPEYFLLLEWIRDGLRN